MLPTRAQLEAAQEMLKPGWEPSEGGKKDELQSEAQLRVWVSAYPALGPSPSVMTAVVTGKTLA